MHALIRTVAVLLALLPLACSAAEEPKYQLGTHYKAVRQPVAPADPSKIEVTEVFAYSCPHCFHLEPHIEKWLAKKPADVAFVRLPHTLGQTANIARNKASYAAQMLGVFDKFHRALFGAIHGQGRMVASAEEIRALFVEQTGVKAEDFDGAFSGFAVDSRFRMGENAIRDLGIASVPALVVEGKWTVTPRTAGGFEQMLAITDYLVEAARKEKKK